MALLWSWHNLTGDIAAQLDRQLLTGRVSHKLARGLLQVPPQYSRYTIRKHSSTVCQKQLPAVSYTQQLRAILSSFELYTQQL